MKIVPRARAKKIPSQAQRMFLSCAAANVFDREMLIEDLLSPDAGMDCVVLYVVDPPETKAKDDETAKALALLEHELRGTQGLVLWVTKELLEFEPDKMPIEYRLARKFNIPVLPIAKFDALLSEFTRKEGSWHAIARDDGEYSTKLRAQLEKLFVSKEQMEAIREKAFIAKLFLSYRKMDIEEAHRFMKMLHDVEGFEAISIWYDNFLTLSDKFDEEIEKFIKETDAFTLLVTPNLLKPNDEGKPNFVQDKEYPSAKEKHKKPIIPVGTLPAEDFEIFTRLFLGVDKTVPLTGTALRDAFRAKLGNNLNSVPLDSERAYHLGMAYLKGYGVERDFDRAVRLLEMATEVLSVSALRAAEQLAIIYENGIEASIDYGKALQWYEKAAVISEFVFETKFFIPDTRTAAVYNKIGQIHHTQGDYSSALEWHQKAQAIREMVLGMEHPDTAASYRNIGNDYYRKGNYSQALEWCLKALEIRKKVFGTTHSETAESYNDIGTINDEQGDFPKALELYRKALEIFENALGKYHSNTAVSCNNIGEIYRKLGNFSQALEWHQKALAIYEKVSGKEHPETSASYSNIGIVCRNQNNFTQALEWHQKALVIREKTLGKEHPETAKTYGNIGSVYLNLGDYRKALMWHKKSLEILEKVFGVKHLETALSYNNIGEIYRQQGDYLLALDYFLKAFKIWFLLFGMKHPYTNHTLKFMEKAFIAKEGWESDFEQWLRGRMEEW